MTLDFVRFRTELCQFFLPHIILDVLVHSTVEKGLDEDSDTQKTVGEGSPSHEMNCKKDLCDEIVAEISTILRSAVESSARDGRGGSGASNGTANDPKKAANDLSVQSIFGLMDTFDAWRRAASQYLSLLSRSKTSSSASTADPAVPMPEDASLHLKAITKLLKAVSKHLLGQAAMAVKAFARCIRYIEIDARDAHGQGTASLVPIG
jgi:hypothetical protein